MVHGDDGAARADRDLVTNIQCPSAQDGQSIIDVHIISDEHVLSSIIEEWTANNAVLSKVSKVCL